MAKFWTKKGPKMTIKFFHHNPNLLYLILNYKLGLKNKICQTNLSRLEEIDQKWSKTSICHHKQCIFDQNLTKTAKTKIFPDTTLPLNDWKQLSQVSDQVTWNSDKRFSRKQPKTRFLSKNGQILDQKGTKNDQKIFLSQPKLTLSCLKP